MEIKIRVLTPCGGVHSVSATAMSTESRDRPRPLFWFILCLCCGLIFIIYLESTQLESKQFGILEEYISSQKPSDDVQRVRTILLWTSFYSYTRWGLPNDTLGSDYFRDQQCPVVNCRLTNNRDLLPSVEMYDAVVFHVAERFVLIPPHRRNAEQQYVFALKEPPGETKHVLRDKKGFFNLTMTYRLDSDIAWPYVFFEDIESGTLVSPALRPTWRQVSVEYGDEQLDKLVAGKKKFAAWFVSHCHTSSKREELTKSLQKYIDVDVFGACGPFKCPHFADKCDLMLETDYKFYFSFENSLCLDYVTEKFLNALKVNIVPVVYGGANYNRFAPPHSYINADDFKTSKELADYLIYLNDNPKEYARYFWWRQYYRLTFRSPFCDLCAKLNEPVTTEKVQFYNNIENWWRRGGSCSLKPKISF